jgi:hypothetical protein
MKAATAGLLLAACVLPAAGGCKRAADRATVAATQLPFIADDYAGARAIARETGRPLFVDAWAPWCHTCLSLRSYVFTDPALAAWRDRFVWLAVDTEKDGSAPFLAAHPVDAWPTLFVIDPATERTRAMWRGALRVDELIGWLSEAVGQGAAVGSRERAAEADLTALRRRKTLADDQACVAAAQANLRWMMPGTSRLNVAIEGLTCAQRLPDSAPGRATTLATLADALAGMVEDAKFPLLPDDRSNGYSTLVEAAQAAHDDARTKTLATHWWTLLDHEAARADGPAARAVFDSHRVEAALAQGHPELAIPALEASARDFPADYNPPARLARLYLSAGRIDEARTQIARALALGYGPRRRRLEQLNAEIEAAARPRADRGGKRF